MSLTLTASQSGPSLYYRRNGAKVEVDRKDHVVPPKGQYKLEISGFAEPFEMAKGDAFGGGTQMMTRIEYRIIDGPGKGKQFTQMVSYSIHPKSKMGKILSAVRGKPIAPGEDVDLLDMIDLRFTAVVAHDKTAEGVLKADAEGKPLYASVVIDTIEPLTDGSEATTETADGWE